jgi:hypothetical protein
VEDDIWCICFRLTFEALFVIVLGCCFRCSHMDGLKISLPTLMALFYPSNIPILPLNKTSERIFQNFSSSNSDKTFRIFYLRQKKSENTFQSFFTKAKNED